MSKVETLNEMSRLKQSGFGRPSPRHGLKLLYWFANDCLTFDENNEMVSECDPEDGEYGFHYFENRYERNGIKLLPDVNFPYYVVGNINSRGAQDLPPYVSEEYSGFSDNSNTDRIITSFNDDSFDKVYITTHNDVSNYDPWNTYRISKGLLMIISRLSLDRFLCETDYYNNTQNRIILQATVISLDSDTSQDSIISEDSVISQDSIIVDYSTPTSVDTMCQIEDTPFLPNSNNAQPQLKRCPCTIL